MSFKNTKSPLKPTAKAKWQIPQRPHPNAGVMEYYLEGELKERFCRLFPKNSNRRMMEWFGIGFSSLQRLKRELGLTKDMKAIKRQQAEDIKRTCEENGYYDSLRGKAPSEACLAASMKMRAEGFHPLKHLKQHDPKRYRKLMKARREKRRALEEQEAKRVRWGLPQRTRLHRPQIPYTSIQSSRRRNALKRGYILGSMDEFSGERYSIFYDDKTERNERFEQNSIKAGFTIASIKCRRKAALWHFE